MQIRGKFYLAHYIVLLVSKTGQMLLGSVVEHLKSLDRRGIIG